MKFFKLIILFSTFSLAQTVDKDLEAFRKVENEVKNNLTEEVVKINDNFFMIKPIRGVAGNIGVFISDLSLIHI